jgi:hypothetical protein
VQRRIATPPIVRGRSAAFAFRRFPHASPASTGEVGKQRALRRIALNSMSIVKNFGAGDGIRTHDPNLGKVIVFFRHPIRVFAILR